MSTAAKIDPVFSSRYNIKYHADWVRIMDYVLAGAQRKEEFENILLELMKEMPYDRITVKDLTARMHFVRKTFYHYFRNKQSCLESLTDRLILECNMSLLKTLPANANTRAVYEHRIRFWMAHRDFLDVIIRNGLSSFFVERFLLYIQKEDRAIQEQLRTTMVGCDEDILFFYMTGQIFLLLKWCSEGFQLSMEEMVQKNLRLIQEPLVPPQK